MRLNGVEVVVGDAASSVFESISGAKLRFTGHKFVGDLGCNPRRVRPLSESSCTFIVGRFLLQHIHIAFDKFVVFNFVGVLQRLNVPPILQLVVLSALHL